MTLRRGRAHLLARRAAARAGRACSSSPGSSLRSSSLRDEGAATRLPRARSPRRCSRWSTSAAARHPARTSARTRPSWSEPVELAYARRALPHPRRLSRRCRRRSRAARLARRPRPACARARRRARRTGATPTAHTTNLDTVDRDGNACVLTTSLGLGSGDWLPGLDLHLNSMLGEARPRSSAQLEPGERMAEHDGADASSSTPTGSCSRSARPAGRGSAPRSSGRRGGDPRRGRRAAGGGRRGRASTRPRDIVNAEPGVDETRSPSSRSWAGRAPLARAAPLLRRRQRDWARAGRRRILGGAARLGPSPSRDGHGEPADVAALGAAGVRPAPSRRAAGFAYIAAAFEAADVLETARAGPSGLPSM